MNDYSKRLIDKMDVLAAESLSPDLFELWEKIKSHYDTRPVTVFHTDEEIKAKIIGDFCV